MISRTTGVAELRSRIRRLILQLKHLEQTRSRLALQLTQTLEPSLTRSPLRKGVRGHDRMNVSLRP